MEHIFSMPMMHADPPELPEPTQEELDAELLERQTAEEPPSQMMDFINLAISRGDERAAGILIRRRRDALLAQSDKEMALDRLNLTAPNSLLFTDWVQFFRQIAGVLTGDWARYRQALRDVPQQSGFPFNVEWPTKPGGE